MSRASDAGNGVMRAVIDYCALYRVPFFRMQSRTFQVVGAQGKPRPMFGGEWTDLDGQVRRKGMADLLLMPRIPASVAGSLPGLGLGRGDERHKVAVPLWVECKAGAGKLTPDQRDFRDYIQAVGAYYLLVENEPEILLDWFKIQGVIEKIKGNPIPPNGHPQ